ncbi:hypothetical protein [Paucibacter soli]|uniref:hypothetical protein n=1 Tax=Paucibacter soli TaxID=3133433 RepID=UPI0030A80D81
MVTSKQMHRLATNPRDLIRFQTTGRLPQGVKPDSPLIRLLESIAPASRMLIQGVVVDGTLGYQGSRTFANAEQALRWIKPSAEVFGSFPAESWQIKAFTNELDLQALLNKATGHPEVVHRIGKAPERVSAAKRPRP